MDLWKSQERTILRLSNVLKEGYFCPVVVSPTGSGKTRLIAHVVNVCAEHGKRVLFLAPRRELIYQACETFLSFDIKAGMIMSGEPQRIYADVQVASFDTLHARAVRSKKVKLPPADFVIVDEAHLSLSKTKLNIMRHYAESGARVIGLTATPARGDGAGLGNFFDSMVNEVTVRELIDDGILVEPEYYAPTEWDLSGVASTKTDYIVSQLTKAVDRPKLIGDIYENWKRIAPFKRTVIFCTTRKHARHVCEVFVENGVACEYVDGETPNDERKLILDRVKHGQTQVLVNVFIATYGLDIPPLECCVLARPTKNLTLYLQIVGRVLRAFTGKTSCTIIDHTGAVKNHGFIDQPVPWTLDGDDIRKTVKKEKEKREDPLEITCSECGAVFSGQRECPSCGFELIPKGKAVPIHKAQLKKVDSSKRVYTEEDRQNFYGQLITHGVNKSYKPAWAKHKYKEKFGEFPTCLAQPAEMSAEVIGWIKSRQIAYHHARKKNLRLVGKG